jgi:hypothetical protein
MEIRVPYSYGALRGISFRNLNSRFRQRIINSNSLSFGFQNFDLDDISDFIDII